MTNRLKDWLAEQEERRRYYNAMAYYPTETICAIVVGIVYLTDKLNFFPILFKAIGVAVMLLVIIWRLFVYAAAKHRPDDWDEF